MIFHAHFLSIYSILVLGEFFMLTNFSHLQSSSYCHFSSLKRVEIEIYTFMVSLIKLFSLPHRFKRKLSKFWLNSLFTLIAIYFIQKLLLIWSISASSLWIFRITLTILEYRIKLNNWMFSAFDSLIKNGYSNILQSISSIAHAI